jgi:hypothetical protein
VLELEYADGQAPDAGTFGVLLRADGRLTYHQLERYGADLFRACSRSRRAAGRGAGIVDVGTHHVDVVREHLQLGRLLGDLHRLVKRYYDMDHSDLDGHTAVKYDTIGYRPVVLVSILVVAAFGRTLTPAVTASSDPELHNQAGDVSTVVRSSRARRSSCGPVRGSSYRKKNRAA